jgi:hypothetical protein
VLRAFLHTLRDRLTVNGAVHLAAQSSELLRGVYYENWRPSTPRNYTTSRPSSTGSDRYLGSSHAVICRPRPASARSSEG